MYLETPCAIKLYFLQLSDMFWSPNYINKLYTETANLGNGEGGN